MIGNREIFSHKNHKSEKTTVVYSFSNEKNTIENNFKLVNNKFILVRNFSPIGIYNH